MFAPAQSGGRQRGVEPRQEVSAQPAHQLRREESAAARRVPVLGDGVHESRRGSELQGRGSGAHQQR